MPIRFSDAQLLSRLSPSMRRQLARLVLPGRRWETVLREGGELLCVVALDETGAVAWAAAEPDGLAGCFVLPGRRRKGLGAQLVELLVSAAAERWPGVVLHSSVKNTDPPARFWTEMQQRLQRAAAGRTTRTEHVSKAIGRVMDQLERKVAR